MLKLMRPARHALMLPLLAMLLTGCGSAPKLLPPSVMCPKPMDLPASARQSATPPSGYRTHSAALSDELDNLLPGSTIPAQPASSANGTLMR